MREPHPEHVSRRKKLKSAGHFVRVIKPILLPHNYVMKTLPAGGSESGAINLRSWQEFLLDQSPWSCPFIIRHMTIAIFIVHCAILPHLYRASILTTPRRLGSALHQPRIPLRERVPIFLGWSTGRGFHSAKGAPLAVRN